MFFDFYEVGGSVRDSLLGIPTKDIDFVVIAPTFGGMMRHLEAEGFLVFQTKPEFSTARAGVPAGHPLRQRAATADFVQAASLHEDLARRDFTVNAMARGADGQIIDPFGGQVDLVACRLLRFVGDPMERIREDGLRVLRAFRFMVSHRMFAEEETWRVLTSDASSEFLSAVAIDRVREEVEKMFSADTIAALAVMAELPRHTQRAVFRDGLRLAATRKRQASNSH